MNQIDMQYEWNSQDQCIYSKRAWKSGFKNLHSFLGLVTFFLLFGGFFIAVVVVVVVVFCLVGVFFVIFTEKVAFKHILFTKITKFRVFLFCSDDTDMTRWNSFKDYDVYIINSFRWVILSRENKRTGFMFQKKKKLKIFISSLFSGKKIMKFEM